MAQQAVDMQGKPLAQGWSGQPIWDIALALLEHEPRGTLLDAPSGGGYLAAQFAERGFQVAGVDLIADLWRFPQYPFACADMDWPLPFRNEAFDAALHVGAIAHMENPAAIFREYHRILKPGGAFVITIENVFTFESRFRFLMSGTYRWYPHYTYAGQSKSELFLMNREPLRLTTLLFQLQRFGFEIEEVKFGGKPGNRWLLPLGWLLQGMNGLHNSRRKDPLKRTPALVNSNEALTYRHVGVRARKKASKG